MSEFILTFLSVFCQTHVQFVLPEILLCISHPLRKKMRGLVYPLFAIYLLLPTLVAVFNEGIFWILPFFLIGEWYTWSFFLFFILSIVFMWAIFQINIKTAIYYGLAAYSIQSLTYNVAAILRTLFFNESEIPYTIRYYLLYIAVTAIILVIFNFTFKKILLRDEFDRVNNVSLLVIFCCYIVFLDVANSMASYYGWTNYFTRILTAFSAILLLMVQFGIFDKTKLQQDKEVLERVISNTEKKQKESEENIQLINMKCHDLKHQVAALRTLPEMERQKQLDDLESLIKIYDNRFDTNNEILNQVLTERQLICDTNHINLSVLVNGKPLSFMDATDLYTLFGNSLDNAIESVEQEKEENRLIVFSSYTKGEYCSFTIENYCSRQLEIKDGFPITSKEDKRYHGFGLKSIHYLAKKYNGMVTFRQEGEHVILSIIFPFSKDNKIETK